jgi:hypothetical protein
MSSAKARAARVLSVNCQAFRKKARAMRDQRFHMALAVARSVTRAAIARRAGESRRRSHRSRPQILQARARRMLPKKARRRGCRIGELLPIVQRADVARVRQLPAATLGRQHVDRTGMRKFQARRRIRAQSPVEPRL